MDRAIGFDRDQAPPAPGGGTGTRVEPGFHHRVARRDMSAARADRADDRDPRARLSYDEGGRPTRCSSGSTWKSSAGEVVLLTGPSGCGKTTLLTLIGGLRSVESGELAVLGHELHACAPLELVQVRRSIGFIFQMHNLLDFLTARQNVQMALQLHPELTRPAMEERAGEMLDSVGLGR